MTDEREQAREELGELYHEAEKLRERMAALKRKAGLGIVDDHELTGADGETVLLSSLFGDHDDLIVIQNMGRSCPYCTMWADGFTGLLPHLESRAAVVLVSPDPPDVQAAFATERGWPYRMLSSAGKPFKRLLGFENEAGAQMPGVSTFCRSDDGIVNVANDYFGPGDSYCATWHFFDLLEGGAGDWRPKFRYG